MKKITCDICKKDIGCSINTFSQPMFSPSEFSYDAGFYTPQQYTRDVCSDCFNRIARAQQKAIVEIEEELSTNPKEL